MLLTTLALASLASATAIPAGSNMYHHPDSPVARMFIKRAVDPNDPNFASNYPAAGSIPPKDKTPAAWLDKLKSIQLPDVPVATADPSGFPKYPDGHDPNSNGTCSLTYQCRHPEDLWNPPEGVLALNFDDGPTDSSLDLYPFLVENKIADKVTHFYIGSAVVNGPQYVPTAIEEGGHLAVHTWSHPYMTTLSNEDVVAELGWTIQIISDLNGGRVPRYWRPPYGDVDNRVRAIAKNVFGLYTVPWNQDSNDWAVGTNGYTHEKAVDTITKIVSGAKNPGVMLLEHELDNKTVSVFKEVLPKMVSNNWKLMSVADAFGHEWYQNSNTNDNKGDVTPLSVGAGAATEASGSSTSAPASASGSGSAAAASGTSAAAGASDSGSQAAASATAGAAAGSKSASGASASASTSAKTGSASTTRTVASGLILAIAGLVALV